MSSDLISHTYTSFTATVVIQLYPFCLYLSYPWISLTCISHPICCPESCTLTFVSDFLSPCMSWHSSSGGSESTEEKSCCPPGCLCNCSSSWMCGESVTAGKVSLWFCSSCWARSRGSGRTQLPNFNCFGKYSGVQCANIVWSCLPSLSYRGSCSAKQSGDGACSVAFYIQLLDLIVKSI